MLKARPTWQAVGWDRDSEAIARVKRLMDGENFSATLHKRNFSQTPETTGLFDFILADIGLSSFQLDDPHRGN